MSQTSNFILSTEIQSPVLRRSIRHLLSIRTTASIETQSVVLNWDKRRTYHALKLLSLVGRMLNVDQNRDKSDWVSVDNKGILIRFIYWFFYTR